jgi:hypothetical protein
MIRLFAPVVLFVLLAPLAAAPVPKAAKAKPDYYPLGMGTKWEYVRNENPNDVWHEEVTGVEEQGGAKVATVHIKPTNNPTGYDTSYQVDKDGWYFVSQAGVLYDPPAKFVSADPKPGDSWEVKYTMNGTEYEATATVGAEEEVTVPAGKYTALPITMTFTKPPQRRPYTNWIVPGVGMVKQVAGGRTTQELKSYTDGK